MSRLFGTGDFEYVNYRILEEPGKRILSVDTIEKSYGPNSLRFGLGLTTDFRGESYFNLLASHRRTWINSLGAEWRTDVQVGQTSSLTSEFYQPLNTRQSLFVAPRVGLERRPVYVFRDTDRIATYDLRRYDFAVDVGSQFTKYGEARLGILFGRENVSLSTGPAFLSPGPDYVKRGAVTGRLLLDQLDSTSFPRSGYAATAHWHMSLPPSQAWAPARRTSRPMPTAVMRGQKAGTRSTSASRLAAILAAIHCRAMTCSSGEASCSSRDTAPGS